jgi:hypothetical protein
VVKNSPAAIPLVLSYTPLKNPQTVSKIGGRDITMIQLYSGGGSSGIQLLDRQSAFAEWDQLRRNVERLLRVRKQDQAAELIQKTPFEIWNGTNFFNDEFSVLYLGVSPEKYAEFEALKSDRAIMLAIRQIAETLTEIGTYIRFVAVGINFDSEIVPVPSPSPEVTSEVVERALLDAEQLLQTRGPSSAVDRIHTAFHGYLHAVSKRAGIVVQPDENITQLFKKLRISHPALQHPEIARIVTAMATIVDSLNPLRNRFSLAHPNDTLLEEAEAMLVINAVRSMLLYVDARVK